MPLKHARIPVWLLLALLASGCVSQPVRPPVLAYSLPVEESSAAPVSGYQHYYILICGAQTTPPLPRYTHCWATTVQTTQLPGCPPLVTRVDTISWLPATRQIRPLRLWVEEGENLDLYTTLEEVGRHREQVSLWGPYESCQELYQRFIAQKSFLEAHGTGYQCIDDLGEAARRGNGLNCFHALGVIDPEYHRGQYPAYLFGDAASEYLVQQLFERAVLVPGPQTQDWLVPVLGLDRYPIARRIQRLTGPGAPGRGPET
jgi:hypothetical protein